MSGNIFKQSFFCFLRMPVKIAEAAIKEVDRHRANNL